ncbi:MAG: tetratricopeptide repeat protein [candidate division WOR-3 bacterium]
MTIVKKVKVKKSELKKDKFIEAVGEFINWSRLNWRYLFIGFSAFILIIIIAISIRSSFVSKERNSSLELTGAIDIFVSGDFKQALELFTNIKQSYYGTNSAKKATYYIGMCNLNLGAIDQQNSQKYYNDAIKNFKQFIKYNYGLDELKCAAYIGIAKAFEGSLQIDSALVYYKQATTNVPENAYTPEAYLGMGRVYEMKYEIEDAINCYEEIIYRFPNSSFVQQAYVYKNMLEGAFDPLTQQYNEKKVQGIIK